MWFQNAIGSRENSRARTSLHRALDARHRADGLVEVVVIVAVGGQVARTRHERRWRGAVRLWRSDGDSGKKIVARLRRQRASCQSACVFRRAGFLAKADQPRCARTPAH
jgi:RNase P protein component